MFKNFHLGCEFGVTFGTPLDLKEQAQNAKIQKRQEELGLLTLKGEGFDISW